MADEAEMNIMVLNMLGKKFNRLLVVEYAGTNRHSKRLYRCVCDCGNTVVVVGSSITNSKQVSCGCYNRERVAKLKLSHGQARDSGSSSEYMSWSHMRSRCKNKNNKNYDDYGGRGISICERWYDFENFFSDMGKKPKGFTLERVDVNGNYEPSNCKWISMADQQINRRSTLLNAQKVKQIREMVSDGIRQKDIAEAFNVSQTVICHVVNGRTWRNV